MTMYKTLETVQLDPLASAADNAKKAILERSTFRAGQLWMVAQMEIHPEPGGVVRLVGNLIQLEGKLSENPTLIAAMKKEAEDLLPKPKLQDTSEAIAENVAHAYARHMEKFLREDLGLTEADAAEVVLETPAYDLSTVSVKRGDQVLGWVRCWIDDTDGVKYRIESYKKEAEEDAIPSEGE